MCYCCRSALGEWRIEKYSSSPNWPEFRGPTGDGHAGAPGLPLTWSETENVVWKTPIHDHGWSSPVIWQNQIWVTTATEDGTQLFAVCVDRDTGEIVHDVKVFDVEKPEHCGVGQQLRVADFRDRGGRVYVHYGTYGTACLDTHFGPSTVDAARSELRPPRGTRIVTDPVRRLC